MNTRHQSREHVSEDHGGRPAPGRPLKLIDCHHHILPPGAPEFMQRLMAKWSPEGAIAEMDAAGVRAGIIFPGHIAGPDSTSRQSLARRFNEFANDLVERYPDRFGLFASLPAADISASLAEIEYASAHFRVDGFGVSTNYDDMWLGDERLWPVYEELDARASVVFVHPRDAPCCAPDKLSYHRDVMDGSWLEWPMNTARTIFSLIVSGTLRRFPKIRFIFSHGGGLMPLLISRIEGFEGWPFVGEAGLNRLFPNGLRAELANLHFECAQAYSPTNIEALRSVVPDTQLLFGSDFPIFPLAHAATQFAGLGLDEVLRRNIAHANAEKLLPRWSTRTMS